MSSGGGLQEDDAVLFTPASRRRRARRQAAAAQPAKVPIQNPIVCLKLNSIVVFSVTNTSYPVFVKDSLTNQQRGTESFNNGPLKQLESDQKEVEPPQKHFAYKFNAPGVWVIADSATNQESL